MAAQQGLLTPVNTNVAFGPINTNKSDRILHNGTDLLKADFIYPKPANAYYIPSDTISGSLVARAEYIDESYEAIATVEAYYFQIDYPVVTTTDQIKFYTTSFIADMPTVGTAEVYRAYTEDAFLAVDGISVSYSFRTDLTPHQYEYTIAFSEEQEGKYWKIRFKNGSVTLPAKNVTEIVVSPRPLPIVRYFYTSGELAGSYTLEKPDVLDICYDLVSNNYYTIRFNSQEAGSGLDPNDDFTTESGSTNFSSRWVEDSQDSSFFRSISSNQLIFSTTSGSGRLRSNYMLTGDCEFEIDYGLTTLTGNNSSFGLNALDSETNRLVYGVGVSSRSDEDIYYKVSVNDFSNNTTSASLLELRVNPGTVTSGNESWFLTFNSGLNQWAISGSVVGLQSPASTGEIYSNGYLSFQIAAAEQQGNNDFFSFETSYKAAPRVTTSGTLNISRGGGDDFSSANSAEFDETLTSDPIEVELFGQTDQTINLFADNFELVSGDYEYPSVPVFTVERVSDEGAVLQTIVEKLNVIKDPTKTYNSYLNGAVQLAVTAAQVVYAKILDRVYRFSVASPIPGLVDELTPGVSVSLPGTIASEGVYSFHYSNSNGGFLGYLYYDTNTSTLQLKTISASAPPTAQNRKCLLSIPDWLEHSSNNQPYQLFLSALDHNSAFYLRKHGTTLLNPDKVNRTAGVTNGTTLFTDSGANFVTSKVKAGDIVIVNKTSYAGNGRYVVVVVNSGTSLTLDRSLPATTTIPYTIVSDAQQMQFNLDPEVVAFSSVNSDDYSLNAGTSDTATITAEVISAWGDALSGKTAQFVITEGDGVVSPPSDVTDIDGKAETQYTVGTLAGAVQIQVTISD